MANTQRDFNSIVTTEIINAYIKRMSGESISSIDSIEKLNSLNFFPAKYIAHLNDGDKQKLLGIFKTCAKNNDFRKFIQFVETEIPGTLNRTLDGYIKEYEKFINSPENTEIVDFTYRDLYKSLEPSRIERLIDRFFGMQNFKSMAREKNEGFSGKQITRILSGLYYIKDEFDSKKDNFEHYVKLQDMFLEKRSIVDYFKNKDEELSKEFFKNIEEMGINSRQIQDVLVGGENKDYALNRVDVFDNTSIEDLEKIADMDEKITSIIAVPFIKNFLGLQNSEDFKDLNELNPRQLKDLESLLSLKEGDTRATIMERLAQFSNVIEYVVDTTYNRFSHIIRSNGESLFSKEEITNEIVNNLAEQGAFAKENLQDFAYAATGISLNNDLFINRFDNKIISKINQDLVSLGIGNICYVQLDGKVYELNGIKVKESNPGVYTLPSSEAFDEIKNMLKNNYRKSFENINIEDIKIGMNPLAEIFLNVAVEQEKANENANKNKNLGETQLQNNNINQSAETKEQEQGVLETNNTKSNSYVTKDSSNFTVFTASEVYLDALEEARKKVREYLLSGRAEFISNDNNNVLNNNTPSVQYGDDRAESNSEEENSEILSEEGDELVEPVKDQNVPIEVEEPSMEESTDSRHINLTSHYTPLNNNVFGGPTDAPTVSEAFSSSNATDKILIGPKQLEVASGSAPELNSEEPSGNGSEQGNGEEDSKPEAGKEDPNLNDGKEDASGVGKTDEKVTEQERKKLKEKVEEIYGFIVGQSNANVIEYSDGSKIVIFSKDGKEVGMFCGSTKGSRWKKVKAGDLKKIKAELKRIEQENNAAQAEEEREM